MDQLYIIKQSDEVIQTKNPQNSTYKFTDQVYRSSVLNYNDTNIDPQKQIEYEQKKNTKHTKQQHLNAYKLYFADVQQQAEQIIRKYFKDFKRCIQHKIAVLQKFKYNVTPFTRCFIQILGVQNFGMTVTYEIQISLFKIQVYMLNQIYKSIKISSLGQGQYGKIYKINCGNNQNIVSKRIYFKKQRVFPLFDYKLYLRASKQQIEEVLMEYSIYKICSFFQIGPKVLSIGGFDIICFYDAIEFYMEECRESKLTDFNEDQMKLGLRVLHKLKIIHKDIKPQNILFSYAYGKYVLTDFGISHTVIQKLGFLSQSYQEGTRLYMSNQMKNITKKQLIDLYYNDYICFIKYVGQIRKNYIFQDEYLKQKMNQIKICNLYRQINTFGMLLAQQFQQISIGLQQFQKQNKKLIKQLICNLSQNNFYRIIKVLQTSIQKKYTMFQECYNFNKENKKKQIQKNHLEFLIRLYGIDIDLIEACITHDYTIPSQLNSITIAVYQQIKYKIQNLIFITENEEFQKFLIKRLLQFKQGNYQLTWKLRTQKLYLLKNLIDIQHKNTQPYYQNINQLIIEFQSLDLYDEYNSILQFYCIVNGQTKQTIEIQHPDLSNIDLYNQTLSQVEQLMKILKQNPSSVTKQIFVNILNKVLNIKTESIYCRRVFKSHDINFHKETNNNMKYKILQGSKIYLSFYQQILYTITKIIQNQIQSKILFKQYQHVLILIENQLDRTRTNNFFLQMFYYKMNQFYKISQQIYNSISYIEKFLEAYKVSPNFTMLELYKYYFEVASNYSYIGDFEKALGYYLQIKQYIFQLQAQNTMFAYNVENNLSKCYYWLQRTNKNRKQINQEKSIKQIHEMEFYCNILQQNIYHKNDSIKIKHYSREIIYLIKKICAEYQNEYYLKFLRNLYANQEFLELFVHFKVFIIQYYNLNVKYLILFISAKNLLQSKLYKQSIQYIIAYIHQQYIHPNKNVFQNTYSIIHKLYLDRKYAIAAYVINKCLKLWQNHEIHCQNMKLAGCYKNLNKQQKYKKYLIKAILSKHIGKFDKKNMVYLIENIIKAKYKEGLYRDAIILGYILKLKFNYQLKKFYALKCRIIIKWPKLQYICKQIEDDDSNKFRKMKFHKQLNRNLKKILTRAKIAKLN